MRVCINQTLTMPEKKKNSKSVALPNATAFGHLVPGFVISVLDQLDVNVMWQREPKIRSN